MCSEELMVLFICSIFFSVRSKESLELLQGMGVLMWLQRGEEGASKVILRIRVVGGAAICDYVKGRASLEKMGQLHREFDCTKGYQGEDIFEAKKDKTI